MLFEATAYQIPFPMRIIIHNHMAITLTLSLQPHQTIQNISSILIPLRRSCTIKTRIYTPQKLQQKTKSCFSIRAFASSASPSNHGSNNDVFDNLMLRSSPPLSDIVWPSVGAFVAMGVMEIIDKMLAAKGLKLTIAPFGAVCAVLFAAPTTPAAQKYNVFVGTMGSAAIGVIALGVFGPGWLARSVALGASLAFMICTRSLHPPAAGLPLLFIDGVAFHQLKWWYALFPGAAGCVILCLLKEAVVYLKNKYKF